MPDLGRALDTTSELFNKAAKLSFAALAPPSVPAPRAVWMSCRAWKLVSLVRCSRQAFCKNVRFVERRTVSQVFVAWRAAAGLGQFAACDFRIVMFDTIIAAALRRIALARQLLEVRQHQVSIAVKEDTTRPDGWPTVWPRRVRALKTFRPTRSGLSPSNSAAQSPVVAGGQRPS